MQKLKQAAYDARHALRDRLFGNNQPIPLNLRYRRYHAEAKRRWNSAGIGESEALLAKQFTDTGYLVMPPVDGFDNIKQRSDDLLGDSTKCYRIMDGMSRLLDGVERLPSVIDAIDEQMERILESYFQSHFKIFGIYFYRTVPTPSRPQSSFLWHIDNCPEAEIKLMVYLDDVTAQTGAMRVKTKSLTNEIRAKGFRNRNQIKRVQDHLENSSTTTAIEGPAGTRILFENGKILHKAVSPLVDHRDVVTFVIIPSDIPWRVHYARNRHLLSTNAGACIDPSSDRPENVGYRY